MASVSQMFNVALQHHQAGNLQQAEAIYRQILQIDPRHVESLHLFGVIAHQVGRHDLAVTYIQQALRLHPGFAAAHNNLGMALTAQGKLAEALACFKQALALQPDYKDAFNNVGLTLAAQGKLDEAVAVFRQLLRLKPEDADGYNNLGNVLTTQGKIDEAIANYRQVLRLRPNIPEAYNNLGNALKAQGRFDEAIAHFRQALRLKPDLAEAYNNLGNVFNDQGKFAEAIVNYREAIRLKPGYAEAHNNLGLALTEVGSMEEGIAGLTEAIRLQPDRVEAHNNLGLALADLGNMEQGIASLDEAIRLQPDHAEAHYNRAIRMLLLGRFAEGWAEYDWRWRSKDFVGTISSRSLSPKTLWDGSPLQGRTILMHQEQGLGDTIQFVRYAALLKQKGAGKVIVGCPTELLRLLQRCAGVDQAVTEITVTAFDVHAFPLSLPRLLETNSVERIPANVPYLDIDTDLVEKWRGRLAALEVQRPRLRVGIVWQGNPGHKGDRRRSVRLEQFAALAELPGVSLVSLQKGQGREQLEKLPGLALDLGPELTDLADTAAVIRSLDLIISVDTVVAHLAGALAAPVWVVLPKVPDWRWLLQRDDSPWYPTMRLFRQAERGQWDDVFIRMKMALSAFPRQSMVLTSVE